MASGAYKAVVADSSPVILWGLSRCLKNIGEINLSVLEVNTIDSLYETVASNKIDLLIVNPTFGGLLHPDEIRKASLNGDIKIFAIEIGKLNSAVLSLYDNHLHVTDPLQDIAKKVSEAINREENESDEKENLSTREKEIISYVVKGFTNQEIADKLFLSVHTVMTHRRNIARKLQIHSATGLTIYAIVNKIVDLSEIKL